MLHVYLLDLTFIKWHTHTVYTDIISIKPVHTLLLPLLQNNKHSTHLIFSLKYIFLEHLEYQVQVQGSVPPLVLIDTLIRRCLKLNEQV